MDEAAVLLWASGAPAPLPERPAYDRQRLLQGVLRHKLTNRILAHIERTGATWPTPELMSDLRAQSADVQAAFERRLEEIRRVARACGHLRPAVLKGPSVHFLTGDTASVRFSNDVDLLPRNPATLTEALTAIGYSPSDDFCRKHEYESMYYAGENVDVHNYFPVVVPRSADLSTVVPRARPGRWAGFEDLQERQIRYEHFVRHGYERDDFPGMLWADATLACLIACTHLFREYCHTSVPLPFATVRLGELAEVVDLARHPAFSAPHFAALADECDAGPSVSFVCHLLDRVFGARPPAFDQYVVEQIPLFPYDLWLAGFVIADDRARDLDTLVIRAAGDAAERFIEALGVSALHAGPSTMSSPTYATVPVAGTEPVERLLIHGAGLPVSFRVVWTDEALEVEMTVLEAFTGTEVLLLSRGDILYEVAMRSRDQGPYTRRRRNTTRPKAASGNRKWKADVPTTFEQGDGTHHTFVMRLDWEELLGGRPDGEALTLLLGLKRERPASAETTQGVLIPCTVRRDSR